MTPYRNLSEIPTSLLMKRPRIQSMWFSKVEGIATTFITPFGLAKSLWRE